MHLIDAANNANDIDHASRLLSQAFKDYPLLVYLFPKRQQRFRYLHLFYKVLIKYCIKNGEVYFDEKKCSASLWVPAKKSAMSAMDFVRFGGLELPFVGSLFIYRLYAISSWMERIRRRHAGSNAWYLVAIAVLPSHQGKGMARLHVKGALKKAALKYRYCYLETFLEENVKMYRHMGFELVYHDPKHGNLALNCMSKDLLS